MRLITYIILLSVLSLIGVDRVVAQVTKSDYFMTTSYLRNQLNPALRPVQGYLVVPVLPNVGASVQTNKFNFSNFTFKGDDGNRVTFMHQSVSTEDFLAKLAEKNYMNTDVNVKIFGLGFFKGNHYWNIDLGVRTHVDMNIPKPFFELLKKGFDQYGQSRYDLSDLSATGYSFVELGTSHSRMFLNDNLILGARVKLIGGLADFDLDAKSLSIDAGPDYWTAKSRVTLKGSAPGAEPTYDDKGNLDGFNFDNFGISGFGGGVDIGAVYNLGHSVSALKGLKISAAVNDLGFIAWTKDNTVNLQSPETEVTIKPKDYSIYGGSGSSLNDIFEDALDDIKQAVNLRGEKVKGRVSKLRLNTNIGVEYEIIRHKISLGALYSVRFGNYINAQELTFSANFRPLRWLSATTSYSFMYSRYDTFGLALHIAPSKGLNLFVASDYAIPHISSEFVPTTSQALNFQVGFSIPLGAKREVRFE